MGSFDWFDALWYGVAATVVLSIIAKAFIYLKVYGAGASGFKKYLDAQILEKRFKHNRSQQPDQAQDLQS